MRDVPFSPLYAQLSAAASETTEGAVTFEPIAVQAPSEPSSSWTPQDQRGFDDRVIPLRPRSPEVSAPEPRSDAREQRDLDRAIGVSRLDSGAESSDASASTGSPPPPPSQSASVSPQRPASLGRQSQRPSSSRQSSRSMSPINVRRSQLPQGQHSIWNNRLNMEGCDTELHSLAVQVFAEGIQRANEDRLRPPSQREKFLHDVVAQPKWVREEACHVLREAYRDRRVRKPVGLAVQRIIGVFKADWIKRSEEARLNGSHESNGLSHRWECLHCTSVNHGDWDCCWNCGTIDRTQTRLLREFPTF